MAETFVTVYQGNGGRVDLGYEYTQDIANNKTSLTVKAYAVKTNSSYYSYRNSPQTFTLTVNGIATTYGWTFNLSNMTLNARYLITTAVRELTHNADGTVATIPASVYCATGTDGLGTISGSTSISIPTIPRTSNATVNTSTQAIGSSITIYTNKNSSSFTHTINYYFGNLAVNIVNGVTDSYVWTLPDIMAGQIPNNLSGSGYIKVVTYSGSTYIGEVNLSFTATIPDNASYRPTSTGLSSAIYGTGRDKTISKYVQNISKAVLSFTSKAYGYASISSNSITIKRQSDNGNTMVIGGTSGTSGTLTLSGTYIITAKTVDSRGRSASSSITITVEAYSVPLISSFTARRQSVTKTNVDTVRSGSYTYMAGSNTLSVVVDRAPRGGAFTTLNTTSGSSGTFSGTYVSTGNTETSSYNFRLTITDSFGNTATSTISVSTSSVALSIKKDTGIGVGKVWEQGVLDVTGSVYFDGIQYNHNTLVNKTLPSSDISEITEAGVYNIGGKYTNFFTTGNQYGTLVAVRRSSSSGAYMTYTFFSSTSGSIHTCSKWNGVMGSWEQLITSYNMLNTMYPIGAIYMSVVSTSPASLFGGTWSALGGRMLIGVDRTYTNGTTGGSATHTLTEAQMPAHTHDTPSQLVNASGHGTPAVTASGSSFGFGYGQAYPTTSKGSGSAHNNMPPYLAVYMWKRTA